MNPLCIGDKIPLILDKRQLAHVLGASLVPLYRPKRGQNATGQIEYSEFALVAYSLVDIADFDRLNAARWFLHSHGYAYRAFRLNGRTMTTLMHREVLGLDDDQLEADHIDGDRLDNRRANLRSVTRAENAQNRTRRRRSRTSTFRGVSFRHDRNRWRAYASVEHQWHHLGYYETEREAAEASRAFRVARMPFSEDARAAGASR